MDGTILNKKYKFEEKIDKVADDCEDLDDRVTALENAPAPSSGLYYYVETREPIENVTWSHTFMHAPKIVLSIWEAEAALDTPIIFGDSGIISTNIVVNNGGNQLVKVFGVAYNAETKTLSYTAANMDVSFNRSTNYIAYLSDEAPAPVTSRKKSKK